MVAAAFLALPGAAPAAPGGDAVVEVTEFTVAGPSGSATVTCPTGTRATGGGVSPISPANADIYRVQISGPVDDTGLTVNTDTGDIPRGWHVTVTNDGPPNAVFRAYALCSANSDAVIQATVLSSPSTVSQAPPCPAGTRAVGGGWGANDPVPQNGLFYISHQSAPVDETGQIANTETGDVARAWISTIFQQTGPPSIKRFFSICSAGSDATIQVQPFTAQNSPAFSTATASCAAGTRALSGGIGPITLNTNSDRIEYSAPLDGASALPSADGTVATKWHVGMRNNSGAPRNFKAMAVCATSPVVTPPPDTTPPETIKTGGPKKRIFKPRATFRFRSSEAGSRFLCKLDRKPARACRSPKTFRKLKPGKHKVTVRAIDAAGNRDATPIVYRFRYIKRRR